MPGPEQIAGPSPRTNPELITDPDRLAALIGHLATVDRYGLDTEFHREKTYWPHLALVQVAWPAGDDGAAGVALIDPLAVDVGPFAEILAGPATMVAHAAEQDLEVLERACGRGPNRLFDTQVAAGFAGQGSASLASLASSYLGIKVAKGERLTDWSRRPLGAAQLTYAGADVEHLLDTGRCHHRRPGAAGTSALGRRGMRRAVPAGPVARGPGAGLVEAAGQPAATRTGPGRGPGARRVAGAPSP